MGVITESPPTPRPATQRPKATWYHLVVDVICTMTPTMKTMFQKTIAIFRPTKSAIGPFTRAPIRVPIES